MSHLFGHLSTRYALYFAGLMSLLVLLVLGLAGYFVLQQTTDLRQELATGFTSAHTSDKVATLEAQGAYLSERLFNPLYNLDVTRLNAEIAHIKRWLNPRGIYIIDRDGRIITDGSRGNARYGERMDMPQDLSAERPLVVETDTGTSLVFTIDFQGDTRGYARIDLGEPVNRALMERLDADVARAWRAFLDDYLFIALLSIGLAVALSVLTAYYLSRSLSRPLDAMGRAAREFASGNLGHQLPEWSGDELGRLAGSLNKMARDLQKAGHLLERSQEIAGLGSWEWDNRSGDIALSRGVHRILGTDPEGFEPTLRNLIGFLREDDHARLFTVLDTELEQPMSLEFTVTRTDGERRDLYLQAEPVRDHAGRLSGLLGTVQDVTEERRSQQQLKYLANYDGLTGLPNRNLFYERLVHATRQAARGRSQVALLFLDLDRFKAINDALGHPVGDALLKDVAERLRHTVRSSDTLARMGGDEFTVVVENVDEALSLQSVASKIIDALAAPFVIDGRELFVSASVGIALYPRDADSVDHLIKNADTAMYLAKEQGKGTFRFFTPDLDLVAHRRLVLENELRRAIVQGEFELHYQPQVRLNSRKLVAVEALLRWRNGDRLEPPATFIRALEDTGLIVDITGWVLDEAVRCTRHLHQEGLVGVRMAVNLSARQFQQPDLLRLVDQALERHGLEAGMLEIEITESTLLDRHASLDNAEALARRGVRLAIDDFGTGYSSLTYLKRFDVDTLKIDRTFVQDMLVDADDAQIVTTLLGLAEGLGIDSVAEGVERVEQLEKLEEFGCDVIQGFLVARAISEDDLLAWAHDQHLVDTGCYWQRQA